MAFDTSTATVTIASGTSLSPAVFLGAKVLTAIQMPAAWDAAPISFQVSLDGGVTYQPLYDGAGSIVQIPSPAASHNETVNPADLASGIFLKLQSGVPGTLVNQTADRVLTLFSRRYTAA
jgi:hypothetical protein